ncbi:MAG: epoxyqueuosine reductase QueH, partial [Alphaproteobacteria bacterium]|nr:epoxyqueuosine reductase QueH [Alphaproteobacteria bacterium]
MSNLRLVLVSCCAPCSAGAIKQLADGKIPDVDDFIVLFFNPNIFPNEEYEKRMREQIKYCEKLGVKYAIGEYDHDAWRRAVAGLESEPERGARCSRCFEFRFEYAARFARENGYNAVASVLGVSRHKDQSQVDAAGHAKCMGDVCYMPIKWDEALRQQIGRASDFYRQNYCGCE